MSWRSPDGNIAIMAVSDGHGGEKYHNSSTGAALACEITVESIKEFCRLRPSRVFDSDIRHLIKCIVAAWREKVLAMDEAADVESYGCTLIAYAQTPRYSFAIQLGDGSLTLLNSKGEWVQPMPGDDRCFLNETTSMCDIAAAEEFRWATIDSENTPFAVMLSTDGIENTFCDETLLYNFYEHIIFSIAEDGVEKVIDQLPEVLSHYSEIGSKDDMTISLLIN